MNEMISSIQVVNDNKQDLLDSLISSDKRLIVELEFVQNLSNMQYLHYLATNQVLSLLLHLYFILLSNNNQYIFNKNNNNNIVF